MQVLSCTKFSSTPQQICLAGRRWDIRMESQRRKSECVPKVRGASWGIIWQAWHNKSSYGSPGHRFTLVLLQAATFISLVIQQREIASRLQHCFPNSTFGYFDTILSNCKCVESNPRGAIGLDAIYMLIKPS